MPDARVGYGLPIGGVLATDNAVIPYASDQLPFQSIRSLTLYLLIAYPDEGEECVFSRCASLYIRTKIHPFNFGSF